MESNGSAAPYAVKAASTQVQEGKPLLPQPLDSKRIKRTVKLEELEEQDKRILIQELENAVIYLNESNFPVYLEGFGIIFPRHLERKRVSTMKEKYIVHTESILTLDFEKCNELVSLHRERFTGILELRELAARVFEKSLPFLSRQYSELEIRRYVRAIIELIKKESIESGRCFLLKNVGEFYALHNRQGENFADWFAGSDILIKPKFHKVTATSSTGFLQRPVFLDPTEPFSALYGSPVSRFQVDLKKELKTLGWDVSTTDNSLTPFSVSVFVTTENEKEQSLLFASDGLRRIASQKEKGSTAGNEFIIQCTVSNGDIPTWPARLFTGAWVLLQSSKRGRVKSGAGLHLGTESLSFTEGCNLSTLFTTRCKKIGGEQLVEDGSFEFLNLIAITDDEAHVASVHGVKLLHILLEHKSLHEVIKPGRSSIVSKTSLLETH